MSYYYVLEDDGTSYDYTVQVTALLAALEGANLDLREQLEKMNVSQLEELREAAEWVSDACGSALWKKQQDNTTGERDK